MQVLKKEGFRTRIEISDPGSEKKTFVNLCSLVSYNAEFEKLVFFEKINFNR